MTTRRDPKQWIRGALLAAAVAGCQVEEPREDPAGSLDVEAALAALPEANVLLSSEDGVPEYIVGRLGEIDPAQAADDRALRAALPPILAAFRLSDDDLVLRRISADERGGRHFRYDQRLHGLDVIGGDLVVHVDADGVIVGVNGTARGGGAPASGAAAIAESAANLSIASDARWAGLVGRAVTGSRMVYLLTPAGAHRRAYEQIVEGVRGADPVRDKVYVDAERGDILAVHPTIHHALFREIYNVNHLTSLPGTLVRAEGGASTGDLDVDGAYDNLGTTYRAYNYFWGRDSYDDAGARLKAVVHYSTNYCNAFWDGSRMVFGDGDPGAGCYPLARALDVVAHELTHAVTSYESNLTYSGEPGSLNESLADIFGAFIESYRDGGSTGALVINDRTFLIGNEVIPPFLRNMCDPDVNYYPLPLPGDDPGPNNLVFCLLSKGGTHPRGRSTNYVPAIGIEKAGRIFYRANTTLLTSSSNYATMRTAAINAASLLGYDVATQDAVACAYAAIGVGAAPASCPSAGVLASGVPVTGISDSTVGNFKYWRLDVPAGAPTLTFTISGGSGDADMYVSSGSLPSITAFQCRPYLTGNNETCTFTPPSAGTYWVGLRAYAAYSGVTLTGSYDPYLTNGVPVTGLSGAAGSAQYHRINVPSGKTLTISISGGTGDADLYTQFGGHPTTTSFACRPYLSGNNETCSHTTTTAGDWYIMLRGYAAYSGVQLIGSY